MHSVHSVVGALVIGSAGLFLSACGNSGSGATPGAKPGSGAASGSGSAGTYVSVESDSVTMVLESGGNVVLTAVGLGTSKGTYTVDGEKLLVAIDNRNLTFIRDGDCIEDQGTYGKFCKGGRAGGAANASTRSVPTTSTGTYVATNADGEFRIEFKPGNTLVLVATPAGGKADRSEGTFTIEGDKIFATLSQGVPLVLQFVNDAYESTSFGLPMRFVKQ